MEPRTYSADFFSEAADTIRVEFGDAWVDIRMHLTVGERRALTGDSLRIRSRQVVDKKTRQGDVVNEQEIDPLLLRMNLLKAIVVAWSAPRPVSPETIEQMPEAMTARLFDEYERMNPDENSDEGKGSDGESGEPSASAVTDGFPRGSAG